MALENGSNSPRILVIDDDDWTLRMIRLILNTLKNRGYRIVTASDGEEGLDKAQSEKPDLIITDVLMPRMNGWTLIRRLRSMPDFAFVPVIFLTSLDSSKDRIQGFRLGADDYLPKPFLPEELDVRVATALERHNELEVSIRAQARRETSQDGPCLQGTLAQIGLASLLTLLDLERKSGILEVTAQPSGESGIIFFRDGRMVGAEIDNPEAPRDAEAIFTLLRWTAGKFLFNTRSIEVEDHVRTPTTNLLLEGSERLDAEGVRDAV